MIPKNYTYLSINYQRIWEYYLLSLLGMFVAFMIGDSCIKLMSQLSETPIPRRVELEPFLRDKGIVWYFIILVIWTPIFEELMFRFWLLGGQYRVKVSAAVVLTIFALKWFEIPFSTFYIISIPTIFLIYGLSQFVKLPVTTIARHPRAMLFISTIIFALLHLSNYNINDSNWFIQFPLIFPQFFSGWLFGYLRMKHGFIYCIALHAMDNFTHFIAMVLF